VIGRQKDSIVVAALCVLGLAPLDTLSAEADSPVSSNPAAAQELPQVVVIGTAPLPGFGLPLNEIPSNVQTADSKDLQQAQTLGVADYLTQRFTGVNVSESADNPFQLDINYHGFTASPLVGTPQGLSVYVDGVRVNESFGDTVNWDLIPQSAISTVSLIGGSNPVFGLNTLGGALSLQTKSGHDNPGTKIEAYGGSFGRRAFEGETGGENGPFDYFVTANYFYENGWRDISTSEVWQLFGKVGWQTDKTDLDLSYTYTDTNLFGNGAIPISMYQYRREQSYTPDLTHNLLHFVNLTGSESLGEHLLLAGNAYYRHLVTGSNNGSNNDNYLDDGYPGPPIDCNGSLDAAAPLAYCSTAANEVANLLQRTAGVGLQLTDSQDLFGGHNQAILGTDYTDSENSFKQWFDYGFFTPGRLLIYQPSPANSQTVIQLDGSNRIFGLYFTDTWSPSALLHFNISARYNRSVESLTGYSVDTNIEDFGNGFGEASSLSGDHTFSRLNPAIGFTVTPGDALTLYANYNQASRAPTVVELGCSNPLQPCGLPNDFASDPDLKQVVANTFELGLRGNLAGQKLTWSADVFRTKNRDDIQFVATSTNAGYFTNVGDTRRQGVDLAIGGRAERLRWNLSYSFVDATFQSPFVVSAESNSTADANGDIQVHPGDRIPLIPRHTGKLAVDYQITEKLDVGGNLVIASGSYLHGNENNANQAGQTNGEGQYIIGTGWIPSYAVINLQGSYNIAKSVQVFARINNLLNKEYATGGFLTTNTFNPNGTFRFNSDDWTNENAISPGAPFGIWAGVRAEF
jgi:iron complex outermembrane recepter protein